MDIIDKTRFPKLIPALWQIGYGKYIYGSERFFAAVLFFIVSIAAWHLEMPGRTFISFALIILILLPFFEAYVMYFSKLYVDDVQYVIKFKNVKINSGRITSIAEILRSKNWGGSFFVRVEGYSKMNGFILIRNDLPEVFTKYLS